MIIYDTHERNQGLIVVWKLNGGGRHIEEEQGKIRSKKFRVFVSLYFPGGFVSLNYRLILFCRLIWMTVPM